MRSRALIFMCCAFCGVPCAFGVDYYVATTGDDDNSGTETLPWRTIQKAADTMVAEDAVFIHQGTYVERAEPINSGNALNPITYAAFGDGEAIIQSPNTLPNDYCINLPVTRDLHHLHFIDLTLRGANWACFYAEADPTNGKSNLVLDRLTIEFGAFGVWFTSPDVLSGVSDSSITNCEIHSNAGGILLGGGFQNITVDGNHVSYSDPTPTGFPWGGHNIRLLGTGGPAGNVVISNNDVHHAQRPGISVWYCNHILIRNNHCHHNGSTGIQIESQFGPEYTSHIVIEGNLCRDNSQAFPAETGIWVDDSSDVIVQDNIMRGNEIGLKITGSPRVLVRRNTVYENSRAPSVVSPGIAVREATDGDATADDVIIVHNTLYNNGAPDQRSQVLIGLAGYLPEIQRGVYKNNVSSDCPALYDLWISGLTHTLDHNTYHNSLRPLAIVWQETLLTWAAYQAVSGQDANSLADEPMFANAAGGDFELQLDSPCIDAGDPLTRTTASGSGTVIAVEDARYFSDGMGVVGGDQIQVGMTQIVSVLNVNHETNELTVDRSVSWDAGEGVSYPYEGAAPDMGVFEAQHVSAIPAVSDWGMVSMAILICAAGGWVVTHQRRAGSTALRATGPCTKGTGD